MSEPVSLQDFWSLFAPSIIACVVASALCGLLGVFVVLRRMAFVSAALGQMSGLGIATGFLLGAWLGYDPHGEVPLYLDPVVLALVCVAAASLLFGLTGRLRRISQEASVAFGYLAATALALLVLANPSIVQEAHEVNDLLFGNAVAVRHEHLLELFVVAVVVVVSQALLFHRFLFVSFDPEMARTLGLPVTALQLWLQLSIGLSVAAATRAVGALPVFGFLVLPAGAALIAASRIRWVFALSIAFAVGGALAGFYLSFIGSWPTGATMVGCCAALWPLALGTRLARARLANQTE